MIRLGLCCKFLDPSIRFCTTTVTAMQRLPRPEALERLATLCRHNADALAAACRLQVPSERQTSDPSCKGTRILPELTAMAS